MGREKKRQAMELCRKKEPAPHSVLYRRTSRPPATAGRRGRRGTSGWPCRFFRQAGRGALCPHRSTGGCSAFLCCGKRLIGSLFAKGLGRDTRYPLISPWPDFGAARIVGGLLSGFPAIRRLGRGFPVPLVVGVTVPSTQCRCEGQTPTAPEPGR